MMSLETRAFSIIDSIDTLVTIFDQISIRKTGPVVFDELMNDIVIFRDTLPELVDASMKFAFALSAPENGISRPFEELLSGISARDVPLARVATANAIAMLELVTLAGMDHEEDKLNEVAILFTTDLRREGIIERLRMTQESVMSIVHLTAITV